MSQTIASSSPFASLRRTFAGWWQEPDSRSVMVGIAGVLLIHLLLLLLAPHALRLEHAPSVLRPHSSAREFSIQIAPDTFTPKPVPKPPPPMKFVETNPNAPENIPDKTNNFGAQNQQAAQEKPTPNGKADHPAIGADLVLNCGDALPLNGTERRQLAYLTTHHKGDVPPAGADAILCPTDDAELKEALRADYHRSFYPVGFARQMAAIVASGDRRKALSGITAPTMVIHGADDPLVPLAGGEDTAATIPGAELHVLARMGHNVPKPLIGQLCDLIERATARARTAAGELSA